MSAFAAHPRLHLLPRFFALAPSYLRLWSSGYVAPEGNSKLDFFPIALAPSIVPPYLTRAQVVVHDSDTAELEDVLRELGDLGSAEKVYPICFDSSDPANVEVAISRIQSEFHPVYVLINNNAVISNTLIAETSYEDWRKSFSQNVDSAFLVARALLPGMRKRKWGRIVNTCSLAGKTGGITTGIAYSTTKGALQTLTFALAREVAKDGITVNGIAPAYIRHPTVSTYPKEMIDMLLRYIPVGRLCEPEEFAFTVKFLISPLSGFICGEIVDQNGGLLMS
jgi:3-oxoacyl-[acyl-carrier protein] reductase